MVRTGEVKGNGRRTERGRGKGKSRDMGEGETQGSNTARRGKPRVGRGGQKVVVLSLSYYKYGGLILGVIR